MVWLMWTNRSHRGGRFTSLRTGRFSISTSTSAPHRMARQWPPSSLSSESHDVGPRRSLAAPGAVPQSLVEFVDERNQNRDVVLFHGWQRRLRLISVEELDLHLRPCR